MELHIISPHYELIKTIAWVELNTPLGNYIIQKGHAPFIIPLSPDKTITFQLDSGKQEAIIVDDGIAEITRTKVTVIMRFTKSDKK